MMQNTLRLCTNMKEHIFRIFCPLCLLFTLPGITCQNFTPEQKVLLLKERFSTTSKLWNAYVLHGPEIFLHTKSLTQANLRNAWKDIFLHLRNILWVSKQCNQNKQRNYSTEISKQYHETSFRGINDCAQHGGSPGFQCLSESSTMNLSRSETTVTISFEETRPSGHTCINTIYKNSSVSLELQNKPFQGFDLPDRVKYKFVAINLFSINLTFTEFLLSSMFLVMHPDLISYRAHWGMEHLLIYQKNNLLPLFYGLRRPRWSVYILNIAQVEYSLCKHCRKLKSSLSFLYQVMDNLTFLTVRDNFREIFYEEEPRNVDSLVCVYPCSKHSARLWTLFIKVKKYHKIIVRGSVMDFKFVENDNCPSYFDK